MFADSSSRRAFFHALISWPALCGRPRRSDDAAIQKGSSGVDGGVGENIFPIT